MLQFIRYYGRFQDARGRWTGLPFVPRLVLMIVALPGLILIGLSIVALLASLAALLLLTVPVYRLLSALFLPSVMQQQGAWAEPELVNPVSPTSGRRHVEVKIVE